MYDKILGRNGVAYFAYAPPLFHPNGRDLSKWPNPAFKGSETWQNSVYYYWWLFLQENEDYRTTCENGGRGPKEELYRDFGNVHLGTFKDWWIYHGREIFREPRAEGVRISRDVEDHSNRLQISVPLTGDLERTLVELRAVLQPAFQEYRLEKGPSQAKYPVATKPVPSSLHKLYRIHRAHKEHPDLTQSELFDFLKISSATQSKETQASTISRSLKMTKILIEQVGNGIFPVSSDVQIKAAKAMLRSRAIWKISNFDPIKTPRLQALQEKPYFQEEMDEHINYMRNSRRDRNSH